jgi:S-adenosylmethionine-diacylgycerolhomoserine-N-methlytransferase
MSRTIGRDLTQYYRLHAPIYDLTRPFFLFGRGRLVDELARRCHDDQRRPLRILEVGCGTGHNLATLRAAFPDSRLVGIDLSDAMLERARRRLSGNAELVHGKLGALDIGAPFDIVIASYVLTMTGSEQAACIAAMRAVLAPGGWLGVVDFHSTPFPAFASWMARNHVRFDPFLPERLAAGGSKSAATRFAGETIQPSDDANLATFPAYGGWWQYFTWIGR